MTPREREIELVKRFQAGDEVALRELHKMHGAMIYVLSKRYGHGLPRDEREQLAWQALWVAAKRFDLSRNLRFMSFLTGWLMGYMRRGRYQSVDQRMWLLHKIHESDDVIRFEPIPDDHGHAQSVRLDADRRLLYSLMERLPDKERSVLHFRLCGATLEQAGEWFKLTKERIRQIEASAIRRLKEFAKVAA